AADRDEPALRSRRLDDDAADPRGPDAGEPGRRGAGRRAALARAGRRHARALVVGAGEVGVAAGARLRADRQRVDAAPATADRGDRRAGPGADRAGEGAPEPLARGAGRGDSPAPGAAAGAARTGRVITRRLAAAGA